MKLIVLSSQECENKESNNGDCFVIDNGEELAIFDCGCKDYAEWIMDYMKKNRYEKVKVVLSHNDDDHFLGIPVLTENNKVSEITTVLLLKYVDDLLDIIDDGRKNRESLKRQIIEKYDNIKQLSGCNLKDAFEQTMIMSGVSIVGPNKEYILNAAAKGLDTTEGDTIDGESITNATSIHLSITLDGKKILLTGDSTFESVMQEKIEDYSVIQLPHHGKKDTGEAIMEELKDIIDEVYIVSDNTGNSNGGSDDLQTKGYDVRNTKKSGTISLDYNAIVRNRESRGSLSEICHNQK